MLERESEQKNVPQLTRRDLIKGLAGVGTALLCAPAVITPKLSSPTLSAITQTNLEKKLSFYNLNTGEYLKNCIFWAEGQYNIQALGEVNHFFRDYRTGDIYEIDQELLALIHKIATKLETSEMIHLISGYRSPATNAQLAAKKNGVALKSQHTLGKAADIAIPGRSLKQIQKIAQDLQIGGVGRYRDFVHLDTGRVRYWGLA